MLLALHACFLVVILDFQRKLYRIEVGVGRKRAVPLTVCRSSLPGYVDSDSVLANEEMATCQKRNELP